MSGVLHPGMALLSLKRLGSSLMQSASAIYVIEGIFQGRLVPGEGLEPTRISPADFKSAASASSATGPAALGHSKMVVFGHRPVSLMGMVIITFLVDAAPAIKSRTGTPNYPVPQLRWDVPCAAKLEDGPLTRVVVHSITDAYPCHPAEGGQAMSRTRKEVVSFKVDEALLEALSRVSNRSEFIRSAILAALDANKGLALFPFALYIVTHELIHIVRFSRFLQNFDASAEEKMLEEQRVHTWTHDILKHLKVAGLQEVLAFYANWRFPLEDLSRQ